MPKYRVTNVSQTQENGGRNVFLTEAGKLLRPGESCLINRFGEGTSRLRDSGVLKIDEGAFAPPSLFKKDPVAPPIPPGTIAKEEALVAAKHARAMDERIAAEKASADAKAKAKADADAAAKADADAKAQADARAAEAAEAARPEEVIAEVVAGDAAETDSVEEEAPASVGRRKGKKHAGKD